MRPHPRPFSGARERAGTDGRRRVAGRMGWVPGGVFSGWCFIGTDPSFLRMTSMAAVDAQLMVRVRHHERKGAQCKALMRQSGPRIRVPVEERVPPVPLTQASLALATWR